MMTTEEFNDKPTGSASELATKAAAAFDDNLDAAWSDRVAMLTEALAKERAEVARLTAERDAAKLEIVSAVLAIIRKAQLEIGAIDLNGWEVEEEITGPIIALVATIETNTTAQCCACGKKGLSIAEDGGPDCQLADGRWTCSRECYDLAQGRVEEAFLGLPNDRDLAVARHVLESAAQKAENCDGYKYPSVVAALRALDAEALVKGMDGC